MKNKISLRKKINHLFHSKRSKEEILEDLEETLILSDISVDLVFEILTSVKKKIGIIFNEETFTNLLKEQILDIFQQIRGRDLKMDFSHKNIIMLIGINGSGKTTQAAKLGYYYKQQNKKVLFSAADTFRAAGSTQLYLWGDKLGIPVVGGSKGADPGSVVFNSINSFKSKD